MAASKGTKKFPTLTKNLIAVDGTLDRLERFSVAILEKGRSADPMEIRINRPDAIRERMDCHNPLCEGGGFSLGDLLRDLVRNQQTHFIGISFCTGQEQPHPEVPEIRSCRNRFEVQATLEFRE